MDTKSIWADLESIRNDLKGLPGSREVSLAITKVEEAMHWLKDA